jgi:2-methylisocitrate lyase-like PEP mutase family enzyme
MGLIFPRNDEEMKKAPKQAKIPLVYVISRGNRDGRPLPTGPQLADMGYKAAIDAFTNLLASFHFAKLAYQEIKRTGTYTGALRRNSALQPATRSRRSSDRTSSTRSKSRPSKTRNGESADLRGRART